MSTALVIGVGPGLGAALAHRFAGEGMNVAVASRNLQRLETLLPDIRESGAPQAQAFACDVANEMFVEQLFHEVLEELGVPDVVIFNAGHFVHKGLLETTSEEFEYSWRVGCMGGFLVGRKAVHCMLTSGERDSTGALGTIIFTGATASLRGSTHFHNLAVGKFGLRALAQSMAREFGPQGIHIGHVIIDGQIQPETQDMNKLTPEAIAENYWQLYSQPPGAWTLELDLRPYDEHF